MKIINLTPHSVTLCGENGSIVIEPSGVVARCATTERTIGTLNGVPIVREHIGQVIRDLPDYARDTINIVSRIVAETATSRGDLYFPTHLMRDAQGRITGAGALGSCSRENLCSRCGGDDYNLLTACESCGYWG